MDLNTSFIIIGLCLIFLFLLCLLILYLSFIFCKHEYSVVKEVTLKNEAQDNYGMTVIKQCKKCGDIKHKTIYY